MPRLFVPPEQLAGERVALDGDSHRHLVKVLRLVAGDDVTLFDGRGTEIEARVVKVGSRTLELALGARRLVPAAAAQVILLQAVPRGERMDIIIQKTTELGVSRIVPVLAGRSVPRPPATRSRRWQTIAAEAARQSGRADVPEVGAPLPLAQALADAEDQEESRAGTGAGARFVLWEDERQRPLRRELGAGKQTVTLLVGPEGGFAREEIAGARQRGFVPVGLGPRILRVETAAIVAVALVQAAAGGLD